MPLDGSTFPVEVALTGLTPGQTISNAQLQVILQVDNLSRKFNELMVPGLQTMATLMSVMLLRINKVERVKR